MRRTLIGAMVIGIFVFALSPSSHAAGPGTTGANFLKIGVGARATAMGEAFTAIADDGTALYWNPAGLAQLEDPELSAMYNLWFQEIKQGYLSLAFPLLGGALGLGANYVDMGEIEGRDEQGNPTGDFGASDVHVFLGYANRLLGRLMFGASGGALQDKIEEDQEIAYLGNVGLLLATEYLSLGIAAQNIGSKLGSDPLPLILRGGLSARLGPLSLAGDVVSPQDDDLYYCAGLEWWIGGILALRAGYKTDQDIGEGISAGMGFKIREISIDYAYVPYNDLGNTHRISLALGL